MKHLHKFTDIHKTHTHTPCGAQALGPGPEPMVCVCYEICFISFMYICVFIRIFTCGEPIQAYRREGYGSIWEASGGHLGCMCASTSGI